MSTKTKTRTKSRKPKQKQRDQSARRRAETSAEEAVRQAMSVPAFAKQLQ